MKLSILQWNIWYKEDIQRVAKLLLEHNADVVCLQELTLNNKDQVKGNAPEYIAEKLGFNVYYKQIDLPGKDIKLANGIFSRYPITDTRSTWINRYTGEGGYHDEDRALIEADLDVNGEKITIATTHMSYTRRFQITDRKKAETDLLIRQVSKYKECFVLTGDLNAPPDSYVIQQLEDVVGLKNSSPDYSEPSWTTKPFKDGDFEETKLVWRLDYVFATPDIEVASSKIINTGVSDHLPVLTEISL